MPVPCMVYLTLHQAMAASFSSLPTFPAPSPKTVSQQTSVNWMKGKIKALRTKKMGSVGRGEHLEQKDYN